MSGTGKSTALRELALRGFPVVETDEPGWKELRDGEWVWREDRIAELLAVDGERTLYVSGCVSNQGRFYDSFDAVVPLSAPASVILSRIDTRTTNDFGKTRGERARIVADSSRRSPTCERPAPTRSTRRGRSTTSWRL
jgi:dephospho-CoA kinase